jgi:hypothetical protein
MKRLIASTRPWIQRAVCLAAWLAGGVLADEPVLLYPKLPKPLKLPPGLVQTLPLSHTASFFGDVMRVVDCDDPEDIYGTCGNQLYGGFLMTESQLSGEIQIRFHPPVGNISHFEVIHGVLKGDDSTLAGPMGFEVPILDNQVTDDPDMPSSGDLDLTTGRVTDLKYNVVFHNSTSLMISGVNPRLVSPGVHFPYARSDAWAKFEQRADGLLDFTFRGSTFLPLGQVRGDDPVRVPLPYCGPEFLCAGVLGRGSSPLFNLYLSTKEPEGPPCAPNCPNIPFNTVQEFTVNTVYSSFGDDFNLDIPALGGPASGRSHLSGRLQIQFGPKIGDIVPFAITGMPPAGLLAKPPVSSLLGPFFKPSLIGQNEYLTFPLARYYLQRVAQVDEPFNITTGAINLKTGRVIGEMVYPMYIAQNVAEALFKQNDGRISASPFYMLAFDPVPGADTPRTTYALFEKGPNGQTVFRYSGAQKRSFWTYTFPSPDFVRGNSWMAGKDAELDIFLCIQAIHTPVSPKAVKTGSASNATSSIGDRFSYSFSIPCDPVGANFSFHYTNDNPGRSGGTFTMKRLASASCMNSPASTLPADDADVVTFTGFGTWSKDGPDASPRFASVQMSLSPSVPYVGIFVYQNPDADGTVVLSCANTKPALKPLP